MNVNSLCVILIILSIIFKVLNVTENKTIIYLPIVPIHYNLLIFFKGFKYLC